jgi:ABC-type multidrug transport system ATPase subunit
VTPDSTGSIPGGSALSTEPAISVDRLVKRFGANVAVNEVSLEVRKGIVYGLIGPNGAGKTTTFSVLCGFLRPDAGHVRVLGHNPRDVGALKGRVGALPQDALLPANDPIGEAVAFYAQLLGRRRREALDLARSSLERVGMKEWWRIRCGALSHGMAKRVGLAQAFLGDPELVLLDEPTAGLDPKSAFQLREVIKQMKGRQTLVISSHNLHEIEELCDAAAILDRGRVVMAGAMTEITRSVGEISVVLADAEAPLQELSALSCVERATFEAARRTLVIAYAPGKHEAEEVIGETLKVLLGRGARISSVSRGRKLEERVMELV